jgi:RNA polymerase sigma-70 factor (ECF subfamily)
MRSRREYSDLDQMPEVGIPATQHDLTELRELNVAFRRLPREQKEALRMIGIEEQSYEEAAGVTGCPVGTLKSRVHRARLNLRPLIHDEIKAAA